MGIASFAAATAVIICAAFLADVGAILRIWDTAYPGSSTVHSLNMQGGAVV